MPCPTRSSFSSSSSLVLVIVSVIGAAAGWSAVNPVTGETLVVDQPAVRRECPEAVRRDAAHLHRLCAAGLCADHHAGRERGRASGLLTALMRASLGGLPKNILVPMVFVLGMLATHANDAAYMVYVPLTAIVFAAAGRHPVLGLISGFAGAAVGLAGNLLPGQYDVLLLGHHGDGRAAARAGLDDESGGQLVFLAWHCGGVHGRRLVGARARGRAAARQVGRRERCCRSCRCRAVGGEKSRG